MSMVKMAVVYVLMIVIQFSSSTKFISLQLSIYLSTSLCIFFHLSIYLFIYILDPLIYLVVNNQINRSNNQVLLLLLRLLYIYRKNRNLWPSSIIMISRTLMIITLCLSHNYMIGNSTTNDNEDFDSECIYSKCKRWSTIYSYCPLTYLYCVTTATISGLIML